MLSTNAQIPGYAAAREDVLEFVEEIVKLKLPNVNLCVASRPEVDIRLVLEPLTTLKISLHDEIGQKKDIVNTSNLLFVRTGECGGGTKRTSNLSSIRYLAKRMECKSSHVSSLVLGFTMNTLLVS